jgi:hypothetical protein
VTSAVAIALTAVSEYTGTAQMFVRLNVVDRRIAEIETIVARVGDQRWFAPENLANLSDIFARPVPAAERHSRAELVAAADAYFTAVQTEGTPEFKQAPFDPALKRFENGQQTANVSANPILERHTWTPILQLERASYKGTIVTDRRYPIVDLEHGSVLAGRRNIPARRRRHIDVVAGRDLQVHRRPVARDSRGNFESAQRRRHRLAAPR